jgi:hypothetical protein
MTGNLGGRSEYGQLGEVRSVFRPTRPTTWDERSTGDKTGAVIINGVLAFLLGSILLALAYAVPVVALLLTAFIVGMFVLSANRRRRAREQADSGLELRVHERGVAVAGPGVEAVKAFRWDEMSVRQDITRHVRNGAHTHTTYSFELAAPGVPATRINGGTVGTFEAAETWSSLIQQRVTEAQLPSALEALQAGRTLEFGKFKVNAQQLTAGSNSVAWSQVQDLKTEQGLLSVKKEGRWTSFSVSAIREIPNFFVFRALADVLIESAHNQN